AARRRQMERAAGPAFDRRALHLGEPVAVLDLDITGAKPGEAIDEVEPHASRTRLTGRKDEAHRGQVGAHFPGPEHESADITRDAPEHRGPALLGEADDLIRRAVDRERRDRA